MKLDKVSDLVMLFNSGEIKYKDIETKFDVKRDLIKNRLAGIGLHYDNTEKKFLGDVNEDDLQIKLTELFKKQRGRQLPKVKTNELTNVGTKEQTIERAKEQIEQANEQTAPTKERTITTNIIRKRSSFDIDVELMKELKIQAIIHDRNVYEIVENAIRKELARLKKSMK